MDVPRLVHDLRDQLTIIGGIAELLRDGVVGPVTPLQREVLGDLLAATERLRALADDAAAGAAAAPGAPAPAVPATPATAARGEPSSPEDA